MTVKCSHDYPQSLNICTDSVPNVNSLSTSCVNQEEINPVYLKFVHRLKVMPTLLKGICVLIMTDELSEEAYLQNIKSDRDSLQYVTVFYASWGFLEKRTCCLSSVLIDFDLHQRS